MTTTGTRRRRPAGRLLAVASLAAGAACAGHRPPAPPAPSVHRDPALLAALVERIAEVRRDKLGDTRPMAACHYCGLLGADAAAFAPPGASDVTGAATPALRLSSDLATTPACAFRAVRTGHPLAEGVPAPQEPYDTWFILGLQQSASTIVAHVGLETPQALETQYYRFRVVDGGAGERTRLALVTFRTQFIPLVNY